MSDSHSALRDESYDQPPARPGAGRPSQYTADLADRICELLEEGYSLRSICEREGMPGRTTVNGWLDKYPKFRTKYARAREEQAEYMDDLILETANECHEENAQAARVKIAAYQWRAAKLKPKKYGDKLDVQHTHTLDQLLGAVPVLPDPLASAKPAIDSTSVDITPVDKPSE